jgi:hypothetical protein
MKTLSTRTLFLVIAALTALPAHSEFGRLFHSPEERQALDQPPPTPAPAQPVAPPPIPTLLPQRIDGLVRLSNGEITLWLDGAPGPLPAGLRAAPFPSLELIPQHLPGKRLRTGDAWQPAVGDSPAVAGQTLVQKSMP